MDRLRGSRQSCRITRPGCTRLFIGPPLCIFLLSCLRNSYGSAGTRGDRSRKRIDFFEAEYGRPEFRVGTAGQKGCFAISWGSAVEKRLKEWLSAPGGVFLMERGPICGLYCFGFRQRWAFGIGGSRASRYRSGKPRSVQSPLCPARARKTSLTRSSL